VIPQICGSDGVHDINLYHCLPLTKVFADLEIGARAGSVHILAGSPLFFRAGRTFSRPSEKRGPRPRRSSFRASRQSNSDSPSSSSKKIASRRFPRAMTTFHYHIPDRPSKNPQENAH
jgi:hypothetical protein